MHFTNSFIIIENARRKYMKYQFARQVLYKSSILRLKIDSANFYPAQSNL